MNLGQKTELLLVLALLVASPAFGDGQPHEEWCGSDGPWGSPGLTGPPEEIGEWAPFQEWPDKVIHSTVLSTGKVLLWGGLPTLGDVTQTYLWDPVSEKIDVGPVVEIELFCSA